MKEYFELERVKEAIIGVTKSKGLSIDEMHEILDSNYKKTGIISCIIIVLE